MLKIDKAKNQELFIRVRRHENRFNSLFLSCLFFAITSHILLFIIFHVQLFTFSNTPSINNPTVFLTADLDKGSSHKENQTESSLTSEGRLTANFLVPTKTIPSMKLLKGSQL